MSINRWMDKEDVTHIYNGILLSHKIEWNNAICSNMDRRRDYHTKWSKSDRERQTQYDITYICYLKYDTWTYLRNRNRLTDIENRLVVAKGEGGGGGMQREFGISRCKLLYIEWLNNKVLLYSTENYIQYPVINHNGKEYEKECVCMCVCVCVCIYMYNWITLLYTWN